MYSISLEDVFRMSNPIIVDIRNAYYYNMGHINGAINIKKLVPSALFIFIMPPDMETLKKRLIARKTESKEKVIERFTEAYNEINSYNKYNYVVVNDKIENAVSKVKAIIQAEKCRVERIEEIKLDNKEELIHEILIDKDFNNDEMRI